MQQCGHCAAVVEECAAVQRSFLQRVRELEEELFRATDRIAQLEAQLNDRNTRRHVPDNDLGFIDVSPSAEGKRRTVVLSSPPCDELPTRMFPLKSPSK